ncbi:MAG: ABC transporter permease subunit [Caldilineaceae bacterium]
MARGAGALSQPARRGFCHGGPPRRRRRIAHHYAPHGSSFLSHIIAALSLAIPGMILAETSLSFLGLGLRPPVVSWGVLLQEAQNVRSVALAPWLLLPGVFVIIAIIAFNFLGDGLRDAADPYAR